MARLPSAADLSGPVSLRSGRQYASADETGFGRGLASLGQDISAIATERRNQENAVDIARAEAYKTQGLIDTQNEFENDPDYSTYGKRAPEKTGEVVKKASDLIRDPEMRERWRLGAQNDAARVNDNIGDRGTTLRRQSETVAFDDALETNRRIYVDPDSTDEARAKAKKDIEGSIKTGQATGLLTPEQADARRKTYIEDAEFSRGKLAVDRDPNAVVGNATGQAAVRSVVGRIIGAESGGNPNAKNPNSSASGIGQFTDSTWLATVKKHRPDLAGLSNGELLKLKSDRSLGIEMTTRLTEDNARELDAAGLPVTAGNLYLAHFAGIGGAKAILRADGSSSVTSILGPEVTKANGFLNGMTASGLQSWAARKMGEANPDWYKAISPEQRAVIDQEAETRRNQIAAETRGNLEVVQQNAPTAVQNTGAYSGSLPSADDFFQAYGPQDGAQKYSAFQTAMETSHNIYDMRTMSAADIQKMVRDAAPTSSGDNAAIETKRYQALSDAADSVLKARDSDPASYVRNSFPNVNEAWNTVAETAGTDASNVNYQAAINASVAAQQQIGVANPVPLPKSVADNAVSQFKDQTKPSDARLAVVSNLIMATPDEAQRGMIFNQLVAAGLPDVTQGAFEALSRGDNGAAQRLFDAAMIDPNKLAGALPNGLKQSDIDQSVQASIMEPGQIGDVYYGLSHGTADNYERAQRDQKLINNAVNLRLRNGETLDAAIAGASKDLYGDVQVVTDNQVQILLPSGEDSTPVVSGLRARLPDVRKSLEGAMAPPSATPSGQFKGMVQQGNIDLAKRPIVKNADGSFSTVRSMSYENDAGQEVLIPTVSDEGKIMSNQEAIRYWGEKGQFLGKFDNPDDATAYAEALHNAQAGYYGGAASGQKAVIDSARQNYIDQVLSEGFFRNSGNGYVFIDPITGQAVPDQSGKPMIFQPAEVAPSPGILDRLKGTISPQRQSQDRPQIKGPLTDDMISNFQRRMGAPQ